MQVRLVKMLGTHLIDKESKISKNVGSKNYVDTKAKLFIKDD